MYAQILDLTNFASQSSTCLTLIVMIILRTDIVNEGLFTKDFLNDALSVINLLVPVVALGVGFHVSCQGIVQLRRNKRRMANAAPALTDMEPAISRTSWIAKLMPNERGATRNKKLKLVALRKRTLTKRFERDHPQGS